jgi:hypothetical protein
MKQRVEVFMGRIPIYPFVVTSLEITFPDVEQALEYLAELLLSAIISFRITLA